MKYFSYLIIALAIALSGCKSQNVKVENAEADASDLSVDVNRIPASFDAVVDTLNAAGDRLAYAEYFLYDLNQDGDPELWVRSGTCEADMDLWVYAIANGKASKILTADGGHTEFFLKGDTLGSVTCNSGVGYVRLYAYNFGEMRVRSAEFSMWNDEGEARAVNGSEQSIINAWKDRYSDIAFENLK